jgi:hypothetical protein
LLHQALRGIGKGGRGFVRPPGIQGTELVELATFV